jgi:chemotaxis protein CheX
MIWRKVQYSQVSIGGLDISPPVIIIGEGAVTLSVPKVIGVNFLIDDIEVDVFVGLVKHM